MQSPPQHLKGIYPAMTANPAFTIPGTTDDDVAETGRPALAAGELIAELGDMQITARLRPRPTINKARSRPGQLISRSLDKATAGVAFSPPPEAGRAISRTTDDPTAADAQIAGAFRVATPEGELLAAHYEASTPMLLPGPQPRGMSATRASEPLWPVPTIRDGIPCYHFPDVAAYRATTSGDITRTVHDLRARKRPAEILATGVRQELATHLAFLTFDDDTPDQLVVLIRDGITRWTACMMLGLGIAAGERLTAKQVAGQIVDHLLPVARVSPTTHADAFQTAQHAVRTAWLREYDADQLPAHGDEPRSLGQRAIHLNQILVVPTRLYLPTDVNGEMIGAIDRMVADIHTGQEKWDDDDQFFKQTLDILHAMHRQGVLSDDELALVIDVDDEQHALARAAQICKLLLHDKYMEFKAEMRRQGTYSAVHLHHAVEILAPVLSRPWAGIKPLNSAWTYKGVLDPAFPKSGLVLRSPNSYLDLVPLAMDGDADANAELRLVGAIALVANGRVSTTLIGGSGGAAKRTRRITFVELFKGLLATRKGLTQLALAADWFHPDYGPAVDPLPAVDMDAEDFASLDANGHVREASKGGVQISELVDLALEGIKVSPEDKPDPDVDPVTKARNDMEQRLKELAEDAEALNALVASISELRGQAQMIGQDITGMAVWQETFDHLVQAQAGMYAFRPTGAPA